MLLHLTANMNSKETGVLCDESEGIPATVTELTELRRIIRLFSVRSEQQLRASSVGSYLLSVFFRPVLSLYIILRDNAMMPITTNTPIIPNSNTHRL